MCANCIIHDMLCLPGTFVQVLVWVAVRRCISRCVAWRGAHSAAHSTEDAMKVGVV
jgi:hypothetical protein